MNHESRKIRSFTDLNAWKISHKLTLKIYQTTKKFPEDEKFGLILQMRRCAVSIISNIAEGFSCNGYKDKIRFYSIALGSSSELQSQLLVARDLGYIPDDAYNEIVKLSVDSNKLINGLIKKSKSIHDS